MSRAFFYFAVLSNQGLHFRILVFPVLLIVKTGIQVGFSWIALCVFSIGLKNVSISVSLCIPGSLYFFTYIFVGLILLPLR